MNGASHGRTCNACTSLVGFWHLFGTCLAIISSINAWKREFIGKRSIELAEQTLAKFFEVKDAIAFIRNPFSRVDEGKTRQRSPNESPNDSALLDRGYIVVERYSTKESIFSDFQTLKYKFMAAFGKDTEPIFTDTFKTVNSIFSSARILATHYWANQGTTRPEQFQKHLDEMFRHEGIFWDVNEDKDEIRSQLKAVEEKLENVTAPSFQEAMSSYKMLTKKLGS